VKAKRLPYHMSASTRDTNPLEPRYRYNVPAAHGGFGGAHARLTGEPPQGGGRPWSAQTARAVREAWRIGAVEGSARRHVSGSPPPPLVLSGHAASLTSY
jgi:hypothetical protein